MGNSPSPLRKAIRWHEIDNVKVILNKAGDKAPNVINNDFSQDCILESCTRSIGNSMYITVIKNKKDILEILIEKGGDVHSTGYYGESCLHCACRHNYIPIAKLLLENGADINATDDNGHLPIHSAALDCGRYHNVAMMKFLLQEAGKPEDVNARDFLGRTPLHEAANLGIMEAVQTLVDLGADVNAKSNFGNTPLHGAGKHASVWKYLVDHGADSNIANDNGRKPVLHEEQ